jgi:diguanylate cyclase (GGDEF)-like protein
VALYFLDLDRFKVVNDLFGHQVGDRVLQEVAHRLSASCRKTDSVARFGGDEFVVICPDVRGSTEACAIAQHLLDTFQKPIEIDGSDYGISASVGIAMTVPGLRRHSAETLLRNADTAMYRAKEGGRGRWELFDGEMRARVRNAEIGTTPCGWRPAPCCCCTRDRESGDGGTSSRPRALLRGSSGRASPPRGSPSPRTAAVTPIGTWVLGRRRGIRRVAGKGTNRSLPPLGERVPPNTARRSGFPALVVDVLRAQASPGAPRLRDPRGALDVGVAEVVMRRFVTWVCLSLDDFGRASQLLAAPRPAVTGIKIDRLSRHSALKRLSGAAIVRGLVNLGIRWNLSVVAEAWDSGNRPCAAGVGCESVGVLHGTGIPCR